MRKFVLAGVIATLGVAMLAIPASASFSLHRHFSVIEKQVSGGPVGEHAFRFKSKLLQPHNRERQGRASPPRPTEGGAAAQVRCRAVVHLNGEIGGFGDIRPFARGDIGRGDKQATTFASRRNHDFNGVAGKVLLLSPRRGGRTSSTSTW